MKKYDVIVVGGGFAGFAYCSIGKNRFGSKRYKRERNDTNTS